MGKRSVIVLPRHGRAHGIPPHRINYRANIWTLHALGVREVLATQSVGSMQPTMAPGHFVLPSQFLDWTHGRAGTFFDGGHAPVRHVDVSQPYCPRLTGCLLRAGDFLSTILHSDGVYACTEGPRFETPAEIRALKMLGADIVGMTGIPEVVLAREAGLCYVAVAVVANWAAGIPGVPLSQKEVESAMRRQESVLLRIIEQFFALPHEGMCECHTLGFPDDIPTGDGVKTK